MDRAVVFLDPFGMQVKWSTIELLAETKKVDLWMLFPASAVIRHLPKSGPPNKDYSFRLTELFGTEQWKNEFYSESKQANLFNQSPTFDRYVNEETVVNYLKKKLRKIFAEVIDRPLCLKNSKNSTLFMLTFAAGNPKGAIPAVKIANHIVDDISNT